MTKQDFIATAKQLSANYQPPDVVRQQLSNLHLVAIVGPTGVGKTTVIGALDIPKVLSDVTRKPREGEKDGQSYHFRTDYEALLAEITNGEFVQFVVNRVSEFYGTRASSYPKSGYCTMAAYAEAIPAFRTMGFGTVTVIYLMPPSYVEWMRRIGASRSGDIKNRIDEARVSILKAQEESDYHFVLNDALDVAAQDIHAIIQGKERNARRAQLAQQSTNVLLEYIGDDLDM